MEQTGTMINRIAVSTNGKVNTKIKQHSDMSIIYYSKHPELIDNRLSEIESEWSIERALTTNAAALILFSLFMSSIKRTWLVMPFIIASFLLQHGIQGWCPPLWLFRRLGMRTKEEILRERYALRALKGDFDRIPETSDQSSTNRVDTIIDSINEN